MDEHAKHTDTLSGSNGRGAQNQAPNSSLWFRRSSKQLLLRQFLFVLSQEHLDKLAAPRVIHHKLFADFSPQFRTLVGVNCERRLYFPRETIVREGSAGDRMFIMNLGSASVKDRLSRRLRRQPKAAAAITLIRSHFGFPMICSDKERYRMTITTDTMCQVLVISRSSYQHALSKYPEMKEIAKHLEA
eukprot:g25616.t1